MKRLKLFIFLFIFFTVITGVHGIFYVLQRTQAQSVTKLIQTLLRQEISSSNIFLIGRTLGDLHETGLIKCVRLIEHKTQRTYLDLTFKDSCGENAWWLNGAPIVSEMKSLNGEKWDIYFESSNGLFFNLSLWLSRIFFGGLAFLGVWFYFKREAYHLQERQKKDKLKELAMQAAHDVASPLSLLNALLFSDLISDEAKEFIRLVNERVQGIVGNLKTQSVQIERGSSVQVGDMDLVQAVDTVLVEARGRYSLIDIDGIYESVMVKAHKDDLYRVLSNLINNAIEASLNKQNAINISITDGDRVSLKIKDQGVGIPKDKMRHLGNRGATFGKEQGTGLGLYHARQCIQSWGGDLLIESEEGIGTTVELILRK